VQAIEINIGVVHLLGVNCYADAAWAMQAARDFAPVNRTR
jgi:hypothetical protein